MSNDMKILQGKYNYLSQNKIYSEENFKIYREDGIRASYFFKSEILTRVKTGEFLKIYVKYRVTRHFDPLEIEITRLMGKKESVESFTIDEKTKNYHYTFNSNGETHTYDKIISSLHHVATPAFLTSMLMTNQKRLDPVQRTNYTIVTSANVWDYEGPFSEELACAELQALEPKDIILNKKSVKALHCKLLSPDHGSSSDDGYDIFLSKHFNVPYRGIFSNDLEILIDQMKSFDGNLPQF